MKPATRFLCQRRHAVPGLSAGRVAIIVPVAALFLLGPSLPTCSWCAQSAHGGGGPFFFADE